MFTADSLEEILEKHGACDVGDEYTVTYTDDGDLGIWPIDFDESTPAIIMFYDDYVACADWINERTSR